MAVKALYENPDFKLVILDRTLAGEVGHLVWSVGEMLNEKRCVLQGMETEFGIVSSFDLELCRMLHPNDKLQIPAPRSHFIKYAAINKLISLLGDGATSLGYEELLTKIGANQGRLNKLENDLSTFNDLYSFLREDVFAANRLAIKPGTERYWQRVFSAAKGNCHIFDTPDGKHPLIFEEPSDGNNKKGNTVNKKWITSADLEYMTLIMIYALVRLAWEKNVLIMGLIKDTACCGTYEDNRSNLTKCSQD